MCMPSCILSVKHMQYHKGNNYYESEDVYIITVMIHETREMAGFLYSVYVNGCQSG